MAVANLDARENLYLQIARSIEDDILSGTLKEEESIPSTNQFAQFYAINPATAAKGVNLLVDEGIVYKKRGIGMFVAPGAVQKLTGKRRQVFLSETLPAILREAARLGIDRRQLLAQIEKTPVQG
ncbi:GntR family transcriptional regulator [Bacillota bacterium Meth-B3]|nr:GntR family transcriptional regulator [Christensenellaceae bacterium]MEA5065090.1 GntR family transcriptional regulator [Eubacteriales bacterium]MEA5069727.1 GntR family transcriptional regulator [Christensenellaceae bacterium]